jgi:hypothetical protein
MKTYRVEWSSNEKANSPAEAAAKAMARIAAAHAAKDPDSANFFVNEADPRLLADEDSNRLFVNAITGSVVRDI